MKREATATWRGNFLKGSGSVSTQSGVIQSAPYTSAGRFEQGGGTNPEELVAAAHAACFSMALENELERTNIRPESIETVASVIFEQINQGWTITAVHLTVSAKVMEADESLFQRAAQRAKEGCPISRLLNAKVTMEAKIDGGRADRSESLYV